MRKVSFPRRAYDALVQRWLVSALVLSIPTLVYAVLEIAGSDLGLVGPSGGLTGTGKWVFWPVLVASVAFYSLKARADRYNELVKRHGQFLYSTLLSAVNASTAAKCSRFCDFIEEHHSERNLKPFRQITNPKAQIGAILQQLQQTIATICGIETDAICASLAIRLDTSGKWEWFAAPQVDNECELESLLKAKNSAFSYVLNGRSASLVVADKRLAASEGRYLMSPRDEAYSKVGSVVCRRLAVYGERECVTGVLSLSTYGKQLFAAGDEDSSIKLETIVLPPFEMRLRLELALLYIKRVLAAEGA